MRPYGEGMAKYKYAGPLGEHSGAYYVRHPKIHGYIIHCVVGVLFGWDHVSVTLQQVLTKRGDRKPVTRTPTWAEMCHVKDLFFAEEETVMQLHPPKALHVNDHPYCLHLWKPQDQTIPLPPNIMV